MNLKTGVIYLDKNVEDVLNLLRVARQLQKDKRKFGFQSICLYYEDIDGDWLEDWGNNNEA